MRQVADTKNCDYYDVKDHSVIYRKFNDTWHCDCHWGSLHRSDCKHIVACKMLKEEIK